MKENVSLLSVLRFAGAFIAWVIGSGFATGQEILQFFSAYGKQSYVVVMVCLVGFCFFGAVLLTNGYDHKNEKQFHHYRYFCGKVLGTVYSWVIPATLFMTMSVLVSAAGATVNETYGINRYIGSAVLAAFVLAVYLIGFEKMVHIVSAIGPVMILFTVLVGFVTVCKGTDTFAVESVNEALSSYCAAPHFLISAVLYLSLNFLSGSTYYTALGMSARSRKSALYGALLGAVLVMVTITVMNTAILIHAGESAMFGVPTLYLANRISPVLGGIFTVVLLLGVFASCSTMLWSFCHRFCENNEKRGKLLAAFVVVFTVAVGTVPFGKLVSVAYPAIGYAGLAFLVAVTVRQITKKGSEEK